MLIAFIGPAGCGKTTAARALAGFEIVSFATPIKRMLMNGLGVPYENFFGSLKEAPCDQLNGVSVRHALQTLGTDWGRHHMGQDFWTGLWRNKVEDFRSCGQEKVVVDDARFVNEFHLIKSMGGYIIKIERPEVEEMNHASEQDYKDWTPDGLLVNSTDTNGFMEAIHLMLSRLREHG